MNKEEALSILRDLHEESLFSVRTALETIVPELKESEDEKIRKDIRQCIKLCSFVPSNGTTKDEMFAWLKKQVSPDMVADAYLRGCNDTEKKWLEKQGKCEADCSQNHQDVNHPNGCITMEDFNGGEGFYKLNIEYLNKRQVEEIEEIVRTWNKDADCKLCTSKDYCISIEKPITIGKCKLTGKAAELAKEVTPESLEEAKKKMLKETEPKFKAGDWLINRTNASIIQIVEANNNGYYHYIDQNGQQKTSYLGYIEWDFRPWTIKDAKDGDVLASSKSIFIFKKIYMADKPEAYYAVMNDSFKSFIKCPNACWTNEQCHPATKEQRELLFKKMAENGYAWDAEKKELSHQEVTKKSDKVGWSEEDERLLGDVITACYKYYGGFMPWPEIKKWLKSIKGKLS